MKADTRIVPARVAQMFLLRLGFCPRDTYDMLADEGADPHPDASTVISLDRLVLLIQRWCEVYGFELVVVDDEQDPLPGWLLKYPVPSNYPIG